MSNQSKKRHLEAVKPMQQAFGSIPAKVREIADRMDVHIVGLTRGLCPSCFGSGFVYEERNGTRAIVVQQGKPLRCSCPKGEAMDEKIKRGVSKK